MFGGAFPCMTKKGCPKSVDKYNFCPCWYEGDENGVQLKETSTATGETRLVKGCYFQVTPRLLQYTVMFQEETTAEIGEMRERTAKHVTAKVRAGLRDGFKDAYLALQPLLVEVAAAAKQPQIEAEAAKQITED